MMPTRRTQIFLLVFSIALSVLLLLARAQAASITVYTSDFIPDGSRSHFNSFEAIPYSDSLYTGGKGPYVEDGIVVQQVSNYGASQIFISYFHPDGYCGWYPNGGDDGYTKITRADGSDFSDVGFFYSTGLLYVTTYYQLYKDGVLQLFGDLGRSTAGHVYYVGFGGGGFDEIRMWDEGGRFNAFAVDAIELRDGALTTPPLDVTIDIKPDRSGNCVNIQAAGVVPVAILSSPSFNALDVDPATVTLAGAKVKMAGKSDRYLAHAEDVNGDGLLDLVCQVYTDEFVIEPGATKAILDAVTFDGRRVRGGDNISVVR